MSRNSAAASSGFAVLAQPQPGLDLAGRAAGGGDEPFRVGVQQLTVQPGPFAEDRVQRGDRGGPEEVPHAHVVVAEQGHVRVRATAGNVILALVLLAPPHAGLVRAGGPGSHIGFDADDGPDALVGCPLPEVEGAEQVAVVRRGEGRHAEPLGFVEQLTEPGGTVQHRVLGVVVEMDKRVVAGSHRTILVPCGDGGVRHATTAANGTLWIRPPVPAAQASPDSRTVSAYFRSCGYSLVTVTRSPVRGWSKDSSRACSHCRVSPRVAASRGSAP